MGVAGRTPRPRAPGEAWSGPERERQVQRVPGPPSPQARVPCGLAAQPCLSTRCPSLF